MSAKHTPGRLTVTHNSWETSTIYCDGKEVARVHINSESHEDYEQHCENASRLAACWNACSGLDTEGLENMVAIGESIATMNDRATTGHLKAIAEANQLRAQCDELLALLRIVRGKHGCGALTLPSADVERIDAAIAKAIG